MNKDYGELFSIEHVEAYMSRYLSAHIPMSALCFNNRFAWSLDKYYQFKIIEDLACLYCEGEEGITSQHIVIPLGELNRQKMKQVAGFYYPAFEAKNNPLKIMYVPDNLLEMMHDIEGFSTEVVHKPDFDEYVYDAEAMRNFAGKSFKSKKNQLNRFFRECNQCSYTSISSEDREDCLLLTEEWCLERGLDKEDIINSDYIPIRMMFDHFDQLDIRGGVIRLFKKVIAFSIGSPPMDNTAFIHFEKMDRVIGGANVAIISEVLCNEYPEVKYVNREEDMGIEGLRIAKQSYNPVSMTHKNDVLLTLSERGSL